MLEKQIRYQSHFEVSRAPAGNGRLNERLARGVLGNTEPDVTVGECEASVRLETFELSSL